ETSLFHCQPVSSRIPKQAAPTTSAVQRLHRGSTLAAAPKAAVSPPELNDLSRSHSVPLRPPLVRREIRTGKHIQTRRTGRQSAKAASLHSCRGHKRQGLNVCNAREHLSRCWLARGIVHFTSSRFISRTHSNQPSIYQPGGCGAQRWIAQTTA